MHFGGIQDSMVGYGNILFFASDAPVERIIDLRETKILGSVENINLWNKKKQAWIDFVIDTGNEYSAEDYDKENKPLIEFVPYTKPENELWSNNPIRYYDRLFDDTFMNELGTKYIYRMCPHDWLDFFYDLDFEYEDEAFQSKFYKLRDLYQREFFRWLLSFISDRIDVGIVQNKIVYFLTGSTGIKKTIEVSNFDIDKIEIPRDNYKYLNKEFFERKVDFDGGNNFVYNFYKGSKS